MAIVAIFRQPLVQGFHLLAQTQELGLQLRYLFPLLLNGFTQPPILFLQMNVFFFLRHTPTLLALTSFDKSSAHLGSYRIS